MVDMVDMVDILAVFSGRNSGNSGIPFWQSHYFAGILASSGIAGVLSFLFPRHLYSGHYRNDMPAPSCHLNSCFLYVLANLILYLDKCRYCFSVNLPYNNLISTGPGLCFLRRLLLKYLNYKCYKSDVRGVCLHVLDLRSNSTGSTIIVLGHWPSAPGPPS